MLLDKVLDEIIDVFREIEDLNGHRNPSLQGLAGNVESHSPIPVDRCLIRYWRTTGEEWNNTIGPSNATGQVVVREPLLTQ